VKKFLGRKDEVVNIDQFGLVFFGDFYGNSCKQSF
jgi:hypothetical protein